MTLENTGALLVETVVLQAFAAYEKALMDNDVESMNEFFEGRQSVVRFGINDEQWGLEQLRAWRAAAPPVPAGRTLASTDVLLLGEQTAVVTTLFRYPDRPVLGRQTQVWFCADRDPASVDSWRIVSAHVSEREEERT